MASVPTQPEPEAEEFSLPLFSLIVLATLAGLLGGLWLLAPENVWLAQFLAPAWKFAAAFAAVSMVNCFFEYFFHRYLLHTPALPFLQRLYKQHTLHHALTRISRKPTRGGRELLFIENKFPITEPEQHEAAFFPWYSLVVFAVIVSPLLAVLQWALPSFPWFLAGYLALACSITLYEVYHAINHWPMDVWEPLMEHRIWGRFWRGAYSLHLRHHAVIDCNESISGFFGLPVADWVFGTCIMPSTIYADGEEWAPEKFSSPRPRWIIRTLDAWVVRSVQERRAQAQANAVAGVDLHAEDARAYTQGERIASWVSHGLGLALSIAGLTILIVYSSLRGTAWHVVSFTVFGLTFLVLYMLPNLALAWRSRRAKQLFADLRQGAIFLLIAGTYTPFLLTSLRGPWAWTFFGLIWGLCGAAAVFRMVFGRRSRLTTALAYLFIGWLTVVAVTPLVSSVPQGGLWLLLSGAICYGLGLVLHAWRSLHYHRVFSQGLLLGGSACHFFAVLLFLLPHAA